MEKEEIIKVSKKLIEGYLFTNKAPLRDDIAKTLKKKSRILERRKIIDRLKGKIMRFVEVFIEGV